MAPLTVNDSTTKAATAPGPDPSELKQVFHALRSDPLAEYYRLFQVYGNVVRLPVGPFVSHFVYHPDSVKHVLQAAASDYDKETYGNRRLRSVLGNGLLFSEGAVWQRQRRLAQAAVATREFERVARLTRDALQNRFGEWQRAAATNDLIDVQEDLTRTLFAVTGRFMLSREFGELESTHLRRVFETLLEESQRLTIPKPRKPAAEAAEADQFTSGLALMDETWLEEIQQRRQEAAQPDLLSRLMDARDGELEAFSDQELLDQVKTMHFAGHDTTAHSVCFAFYLLSQHPEMQRRIRDEAHELESAEQLLDACSGLRHAESAALETLRLYPAVPAIERRALRDDRLGGFHIPKGSSVVTSPYVTHRHPEFWQDPLEYRPERFLEPGALSHRHAFFPFGSGPRLCVGNNLGLVQLKLILALVLRRFRLELPDDFAGHMKRLMILRFDPSLRLRVREWNGAA